MADEKMPLAAHLEELRRRLIICCVAVAVGFCISYFVKEQLFLFLAKPLQRQLPEGSALQYIGVAEAFVTYLKLSLIAGVFLAMPVLLYEVWMFVAPGLYEREKRYVIPVVLFSLIFFFGGAAFCYVIVFPFAFKFFMAFSSDTLRAMPTTLYYLSFAWHMMLAFGLVFQMPIAFFFLGRMGLVTYKGLARQRRYAIVLVFVAAALLTPGPDVISQLLLAGPLLVLFEMSLQVVRLTGKKREWQEEAEISPAG
ncbi:MAG: twin-arginine translocase subunit TatC [bacterium]